MADEVRDLYELAGREMSPELRARLSALAERALKEEDAAEPPLPPVLPDDDGVVLLDLVAGDRRARRVPARWLSAAALIVAGVGVGVVVAGSRDRQHVDSVAATVPPPATTVAPPVPPAPCLAEAQPVGVVDTASGAVRVGLMPDGSSFCLADERTGAPLAAGAGAATPLTDGRPGEVPTEAAVTAGRVLGANTFVYIAIPDDLPVTSVSSPDQWLQWFPATTARKLLVVYPDHDATREPTTVTLHDASGAVLATLEVAAGELPAGAP